MNYKKILRNRSRRVKIIDAFSFIADKPMVKFQYFLKTGRRLNLKHPKRFSEKLQYYKLCYRDPLMQKCADKYTVREYVKKCGFEEILNPVFGVYNSIDEADFASLPDQFVIKDTLGGGGNSVAVVEDKNREDIGRLKETVRKWMVSGRKHPGREWVYEKRRNRILIEQFISSDRERGGLIDYKFLCFQGKVKYLYIIADRIMGQGAGLAIYDSRYHRLPYLRADERPLQRDVPKPENYEKMVFIAEKLSRPFPHARIDLYDQDGKILFGEITFFDGSGYMTYEPDEFDEIIGREFDIDRMRMYE